MDLSFWEKDLYFDDVDFTIIGGGITGLSTAFHLRENHPEAKIIVLERGTLPSGASTKNAGFACFGTLSEILYYLENEPEEVIYALIKKRYEGLQALRKLLGDESIGYHSDGGHEVFLDTEKERWERALNEMDRINHWIEPIFGEAMFKRGQNDFGLEKIIGLIENPFEGNLHPAKMIRTFQNLVATLNVPVLNGMEVTEITDTGAGVELEINNDFQFKTSKVFICTNGFASSLADLDILPARGQVVVTSEIPELKLKGNFHINEGFYYFRNVGNRVLLGGGRNLDFEGETTETFGLTETIQQRLEDYLREIILPGHSFEIAHRWSGIMGMGSARNPIIRQLSDNVYCGVRLSGIGVAIGTLVGKELAELL